jgi:ABC-type sugar transport system ATPase subunit
MIEMLDIHKSFSGIRVLKGVSLRARAGRIHALVGENGAGKSTLIKTMAGVIQPDSGKIALDGRDIRWRTPGEAKAHGVHVIYQEFVQFAELSVAENIFMGDKRLSPGGFLKRRDMNQRAAELLSKLGVQIDPTALVGDLSVADQQMVEIAKALSHKVQVLILDEPTAVISGLEVELLFERLRQLRQEGVAIIYVSHRLEEIFQLCDDITVIKDGELVGSRLVSEIDQAHLVAMMVGRQLADLYPARRTPDQERTTVLTAKGIRSGTRVKGCSLSLRRGEITALAGMIGSGRTELAMALFGAQALDAGSITVNGAEVAHMTPALAIRLGLGLLTEDRKKEGLAMLLDVASNVTAANLDEITRQGMLDKAAERRIAEQAIAQYSIACRGPSTAVALMSGGNQQKVLLARWARTATTVLILDEPTRGVDVGAKADIYRMMQEAADKGLAILMISSELLEVVGMAERVYVMRDGKISGELTGEDISEHAIMTLATKAHQEEVGVPA